MKKAMKLLCLVLAIFVLMPSIVACNSSAKEVQKTNTISQESTLISEPTEIKEVTINYRTFRTDDEKVMNELVAKFESENPGIKINYTAERDETAYYQKLQADILSGQGIDVFDVHPNAKYSTYVNGGYILDISDLDFNKVYDSGVASVSTIDGKNYGYILATNLYGIFYNKDLFKEMNAEVPTSYEELKVVVEKSKAAGYGGISYCGATVVGNWLANALLSQGLQTENFHDFWEQIGTGKLTDINQNPDIRKVFDSLAAFNKDKLFYDNAEAIQYDQSIALFSQKKASMMFMGSWELANLDTTYKDMNIGIFQLPSLNGSKIAHAECGQVVSIYSKTPNPEAAKKWVEFLATPENAAIYTTSSKGLSSIEGVKADFVGNEILKTLSENGISALPLNDVINYDIWGNILINMYTNILFGSGDVDAELSSADKLLKEADLANKA